MLCPEPRESGNRSGARSFHLGVRFALPAVRAYVCLVAMSFVPTALVLIFIAYVCGSLPFGYWAGRLKGVDIRKHGSGNIGATNVIRVLGKRTGIPVFILDMLKGFLPVLLAERWMKHIGAEDDGATLVAVFCAAAAVLGHMFTFWLGFKGGKGVATSAGVLLGLAWPAMVVGLIIWLIVFYSTRYVALASIGASIAIPLAMAVSMTFQHRWNFVLLGLGLVMGTLVVVRHRSNIARLFSGTEKGFAKKKK
jgi:glycerol-3-phosphate acyltransferase PlsY